MKRGSAGTTEGDKVPESDRSVWSGLRYLAMAVAVTGAVLSVGLTNDRIGVYVLAAGLLLVAVMSIRGDAGSRLLLAGLAAMIIADHNEWAVLFYLSCVAILGAAALVLWQSYGASRRVA